MTFKKNAFLAKVCVVGIIYCSVLFIPFILLMVFLCLSNNPSVSMYIALGIFSGLSVFSIMYLAVVFVDSNSEVLVTKEGIELRSKIARISPVRYMRWEECGFIGVYGYYYGLRANLFLSKERYICYSPSECARYVRHATKKRKEIILLDCTPELWAAVEKYAPEHLVRGCKSLFSQ